MYIGIPDIPKGMKQLARMYPMFSSSKGNCIYFGDREEGILVDCGVCCKQICAGLSQNGLSPEAVKGIFITHTHSDHVKGLTVFLKKYRIPVYALQANLDILYREGKLPEGAVCYAVDNDECRAGGFSVSHFNTQHDTPANCGYRITYPDGKVAALCTDLGIVTDEVWESICGADLVMLESNYDPDMLRCGSYPWQLKERIASDFGHLSNPDCGQTLCRLIDSGTVNFVLGHLSPENNTPDTAERSAVNSLLPKVRNKDYLLYIAPERDGKAVVF